MRLVKRPNSKNWFVEVQIDGKYYCRSTKTGDKNSAKLMMDHIIQTIHEERTKPTSNEITLIKAIDRYIELRFGTPNYYKLKHTKSILIRHFKAKMPLSKITNRQLADFVQTRRKQGLKPQTVKHGVAFLCAVVKEAKKDGYNVPALDPPKISVKPTKLRYLTIEEEKRLLRELDPERTGEGIPPNSSRTQRVLQDLQDNYDLVVVLLDTGARYGEIAKLTWQQIDLQNRTINLWRSKVSNESILYMTFRVYEILQRRSRNKTSDRYLFTNRKGEPRGGSNLAVRRAFKRAGLHDCSIHTLRHTHASRLVQNGLSIYEVKTVLGHTDITTTMRYAHLENTDVTQRARDVIEGLR